MEVIAGRHRGRPLKVEGFANDWIAGDFVDDLPGRVDVILRPTQVRVTSDEERQRFDKDSYDNPAGRFGFFFDRWELDEDGTFTDLDPRGERTGVGRWQPGGH